MTRRANDPVNPPITDILDVAVRAHGGPRVRLTSNDDFSPRGPSHWSLILDTETTTDAIQRLRIGCYQVRDGDQLKETGLFINPDALTPKEQQTAKTYAAKHRLKLVTLREFIETIFIPVAHYWRATVIGFNLPFDLSRLAEEHSDARGKMRPGLSLSLRPKGKPGPKIRIKHLVKHVSLIDLSAAGRPLPRGQRRRKIDMPRRRTAFVDVGTLASALLSRPFNLGGLAKYLKTAHQKLGTDEHGNALTPEYLDYAVRDVQVTWECYVELRQRYSGYRLTSTPVHRILSEASLGKAHLREMGIRPLLSVQPDFPSEMFGKIMGAYYGGRAEVHWRRVIKRVLYCDFTSMYPTVSALMGLWPFVIAKNVTWRDATAETRRFVENVTLADLQRPETWKRQHVLVWIKPHGDVLPVRAKYELEPDAHVRRERHYTIGLNHLTSKERVCYTLADVIASKLHTGRAPEIVEAIAFGAGEPQEGLKPVAIAGNPDFLVDPLKEDFFKRIIELRMQTKGPQRNALKLIANASGYGIFVQLNVSELAKPALVKCHPASGREFTVKMDKVEEPGEYFHPLLGALITGAARLKLAITERLIADAGLTWTFCDTDSMAVAQPEGMSEDEFMQKAEAVRAWFKPLNPYAVDVDLLKLEDANFKIVDGKRTTDLQPLYCFAISSKRYVLFNVDARGQPIIRKASAHGLGHLVAPYGEKDAPTDIPAPIVILDEQGVNRWQDDIGVSRWQYDFWYCIARAALAGNPDRPDYLGLPNFDLPAVSRYAITTANLARWFDRHNQGKAYGNQIRPFTFMMKLMADPMADWEAWRAANGLEIDRPNSNPPCVIAPFNSDISKAAERGFDRDTGLPVPPRMLKTYRQVLQTYHRSPEAKFLNAGYIDKGLVQRRHVTASNVVNIGKEAHRWEEQSMLGVNLEAEIAYGRGSGDRPDRLARIRQAISRFGPTAMAEETGFTRQYIHSISRGKVSPGATVQTQLVGGIRRLEGGEIIHAAEVEAVLVRVKERCQQFGRRSFAVAAGIGESQLSRLLALRRPVTKRALAKLRGALAVSRHP